MIFPWEGHALRQCGLQRVHYDKVLRYTLGLHVEGLGLIVNDPKRIHNKMMHGLNCKAGDGACGRCTVAMQGTLAQTLISGPWVQSNVIIISWMLGVLCLQGGHGPSS